MTILGYSGSWAKLTVSPGDCDGCTWAGVVEAYFNPADDTAAWSCPNCATENGTATPLGDVAQERDR